MTSIRSAALSNTSGSNDDGVGSAGAAADRRRHLDLEGRLVGCGRRIRGVLDYRLRSWGVDIDLGQPGLDQLLDVAAHGDLGELEVVAHAADCRAGTDRGDAAPAVGGDRQLGRRQVADQPDPALERGDDLLDLGPLDQLRFGITEKALDVEHLAGRGVQGVLLEAERAVRVPEEFEEHVDGTRVAPQPSGLGGHDAAVVDPEVSAAA